MPTLFFCAPGGCMVGVMIVLYTDFGLNGPYVGQMKVVLARLAADHVVIDLQHDAPSCNPKAAAYLLASLIEKVPVDCIFLCVVDPGVGGSREPGVLKAGDQWFIGPDNGLFEIVVRQSVARGMDVQWWDITWRPDALSTSFHGRDVFAPVAAWIAMGQGPSNDLKGIFSEREISAIRRENWPDDLPEVIYIDEFGNAMTGISGQSLNPASTVTVNDQRLHFCETFSGVSEGACFWYENSCGLVELAVNRGRAEERLDLAIGTAVFVS